MRIIAVVFTLFFVFPAAGAEHEIAKLMVGSGYFKNLGTAVALYSMPAPTFGVAITGSPGPVGGGNSIVGEAYITMPTAGNWNTTTSSLLMASDGGIDDYFGAAVDLNGLDALVGAPGKNAVYIYLNGSSERKITSSSFPTEFGSSVAFNGSSIAIGGDESAHIFTDTSGGDWSTYSEFVFHPSDPNAMGFGSSIDYEGPTMVVGAPLTSMDADGAIFIYQGLAETKIVAYDNASEAQFGTSVSCDGSTIAVGASADSAYAGSVYILQDISAGGDWSAVLQKKIVPSDPTEWDHFGVSVSIEGSILAVGATRKSSGAIIQAGGVYIFKDTSAAGDWSSTSETILQSSDAGEDDRLGRSVAVADGRVLSGAYRYDQVAFADEGAVYIFDAHSKIFDDDFESGDISGWTSATPKY